jgi:hypothetical protein
MILVLSWCMTLNTMWQMIQLHECVPGTRFDRYIDLGRHAFGPKLGPWIVLPQQLIVQVGCDIVYMVTGGKCLKKFMEISCTNCTQLKQSYWILIFGSIHFFLSQLPNFNSVAGVSLAAAVMSLRHVPSSLIFSFSFFPRPAFCLYFWEKCKFSHCGLPILQLASRGIKINSKIPGICQKNKSHGLSLHFFLYLRYIVDLNHFRESKFAKS